MSITPKDWDAGLKKSAASGLEAPGPDVSTSGVADCVRLHLVVTCPMSELFLKFNFQPVANLLLK